MKRKGETQYSSRTKEYCVLVTATFNRPKSRYREVSLIKRLSVMNKSATIAEPKTLSANCTKPPSPRRF